MRPREPGDWILRLMFRRKEQGTHKDVLEFIRALSVAEKDAGNAGD